MTTWQVTEAKARFGELINRAITEGPQTITRRGACGCDVDPGLSRPGNAEA